MSFIRTTAKENGFDRIFEETNTDLLLGPLDGRIVTIAAAAGYPCGVVPLGYADDYNGRAYGAVFVSRAGMESKILQAMNQSLPPCSQYNKFAGGGDLAFPLFAGEVAESNPAGLNQIAHCVRNCSDNVLYKRGEPGICCLLRNRIDVLSICKIDEFNTSYASLSVASTNSIGDPVLTPLPSQTGDDDEDDIVASWEWAKQQCEKNLNPYDFAKLQDFPTPEKLADDLRTKEPQRPNFHYIRPAIKSMRSFLQFFVVTMSPRNIEGSIFWGIFYLLVQLADSQKDVEDRWYVTMGMVEKITRALDVCRRSHENLPFDLEMKLALNEAIVALITFWAEAVQLMREDPHDTSLRTGSAVDPEQTKAPVPSNVDLPCGGAPLYNETTFYGREDVLKRIDERLCPTPGKESKFFTLCGLGGVGKSKLALVYAKRYGHKFDVALWIKSETQVSLRKPGIYSIDPKVLCHRPVVCLDVRTTRYPEEALYLRARGHVFSLKEFSLAESHELFKTLLGSKYLQGSDVEEEQAANILMQKMGGLAIGICTIAVRIGIKNLSIQSFLKKYLKERTHSDQPELEDYDLTMDTLWNDSFISPRKAMESEEDCEGKEGFKMLGILMLCAPDNIQKELFIGPQLQQLRDVPEFCHDDDELNAMDPLRNLGLIDVDFGVIDFKAIAIHRLVQSAFHRFLSKEEYQNFFDLTVRVVHRAFPKQIEGCPLHLQWDDCRRFIQHGTWLASTYSDSKSSTHRLQAGSDLALLLHNCAWYLHEIGESSECLRITNIALTAVEKNSQLHSSLENSLKATYQFQNKLALARKHSLLSLKIMKEHVGDNSEFYTVMRANHANLLFSEGRNEESLQTLLGIEKTRISRAELFKGNAAEAKRTAIEAQEVVIDIHRERGQYMEDVLLALGNVELRESRFESAEQFYEQGLELQEDRDKGGVFIASFLYKLACVKLGVGKLDEARSLLDRALEIAILSIREGEEARVLYKMVQVLRRMELPLGSTEIDDVDARARLLKTKVEEDFGDLVSDPSIRLSEQQQYNK
ncbi:hypothetical protein ACEPPN_000914 [Leptodophora sp. 'Broadleaf-Isolate-01']